MQYEDYKYSRYQYQEIGRDLLLEKKHACLFFSPGKGKTYPAIDAIRQINLEKNEKAKVLIISTCDAIRKMWQPEIVPQNILPKDTYLVTDRTAIGDLSTLLLSTNWDIIVVDECHILKSYKSKIHKLVYRLSNKTEYVFGLTGTPRGNTDIDIWCQLRALNVGGQGKMSYTAWTRNYCEFEIGWGAYGQYRTPIKIKDKYLLWWNNLLSENCLFVDYDDDDNMPDLSIEVKQIPYIRTKEYDEALKGIIDVGDFATTMTKLVAITKAHQVANGYIYLPDKTIHRLHKNGKLEYLNKELENVRRAVIVYRYIADYEDLLEHLRGRVTTDVTEFKEDKHQILLLQCGHCQSFNLQNNCNTIIFYTLDYSFIKYKQMIHRCWRIGQKRPTRIVVLQHANTIEKQIWNAVVNKQKAHALYMSIKRES